MKQIIVWISLFSFLIIGCEGKKTAEEYYPMADGIALEGIKLINQWLLKELEKTWDYGLKRNIITRLHLKY